MKELEKKLKKPFNLRVDPEIHNKLIELAKNMNTSVSSLYTSSTEKLLNSFNSVSNEKFYNLNIERALLSSIIYEPILLKDFLKMNITKEDFYLPFHKYTFSVIQELEAEGKPIDEEFIKSKLLKRDEYNEIAFLDVLAANSISNPKAYCIDLLEKSNRRKLNILILQYRSALQDSSESVAKIKGDLVMQLENIKDTRDKIVQPTSILDIEEEDIYFYTKDWLPIPKKAITILGGAGGASKSALILQLLMRLLKEDPGLRVFGWLSEDLKGYTKKRFSNFKNDFFQNEELELFRRIDISGSSDIPFFVLNINANGIEVSEEWYKFKEEMSPYDIIVLDPLIAFFGGEENSNTHARKFMNLLNEWVEKEDKTLILIHHSKKPTGKDNRDDITIRGAGAIVDAARLAYEAKGVSLDDYKKDYKLFTGIKYNSLLPQNIEEEGSSGNYLAKSAIMTHRRILIAKDNLGVKLLLKNKTNSKQIFYIKTWGEEKDYEIIEEDNCLGASDFNNVSYTSKEDVTIILPKDEE